MTKKEVSVSIVMPTFEIHKSEEALRDIFKQNYPLNEVIVINDNPHSKPSASILKFIKEKKIKLINNPRNMGIAKSVNAGILASKSDVIVIVCRDHFAEDKNWIRHIVEKLSSDKKIGAVLCPYVWPVEAWRNYNFLTKLFTFRFISKPAYGGFNYKKEVFNKIGLLDTKRYIFAGEDCDISIRMNNAGYHAEHIEDRVIHVHYDKNSKLSGVFQKEYRYGGAHGAIKRQYGLLTKMGMFSFEIRILFIMGFLIGLFTNRWLSLVCSLPFFFASSVQAIRAFRTTKWLPGLLLYPFAGIFVLLLQTLGAIEGFAKGKQDK